MNSSFQTFYIPLFQDSFLLFSSYFFKGPIYCIEVFIGNWYYCYYFSNIQFMSYFMCLISIYYVLLFTMSFGYTISYYYSFNISWFYYITLFSFYSSFIHFLLIHLRGLYWSANLIPIKFDFLFFILLHYIGFLRSLLAGIIID